MPVKKRPLTKAITLYRCSRHGFWAFMLEDQDGGVRLTPSKCCGNWGQPLARWPIDQIDVKRLVREIASEKKKASRR